MSFASLQDVNISAFPQEVLEFLHRRIISELDRRSAAKKIDDREVRELRRRSASHRKMKRKAEHFRHPGWIELYPDDGGDRRFYVYAHVRPNSHAITVDAQDGSQVLEFPGIPFYIGKGCGDRAFSLARNEGHAAHLKEILGSGAEADGVIKIVRSGLTENQALRLESQLIYLFGTRFEIGIKGTLVNLDIPKRPKNLGSQG